MSGSRLDVRREPHHRVPHHAGHRRPAFGRHSVDAACAEHRFSVSFNTLRALARLDPAVHVLPPLSSEQYVVVYACRGRFRPSPTTWLSVSPVPRPCPCLTNFYRARTSRTAAPREYQRVQEVAGKASKRNYSVCRRPFRTPRRGRCWTSRAAAHCPLKATRSSDARALSRAPAVRGRAADRPAALRACADRALRRGPVLALAQHPVSSRRRTTRIRTSTAAAYCRR